MAVMILKEWKTVTSRVVQAVGEMNRLEKSGYTVAHVLSVILPEAPNSKGMAQFVYIAAFTEKGNS